MPYTVEYNQGKGYIMVVVQGELNLSLVQSMAADVSKIVSEKGCKFILNDLRQAEPAPKNAEIYDMPAMAKKAGVTLACKRALVVGDRASEFYFLETVFLNQGHLVKMLANIDDAEAWLFGEKGKE